MSSDINVQTFSGKVNITSNLLVGTSHLFVDTINNRVGLVTNTPDAGLHVNSNAYVHTDFRVGSGIVMNDTAGQITAGSFVGDGSAMTGINSDSGSWVNGTDVVYLSTTTDKVGIGTTDPEAQLHIGPKDNDHIYLASANNNYGWKIDTDDQGSGAVPFRIIKRTDDVDTTVLTIKNQDGNVGIGTTNPTDLLDVHYPNPSYGSFAGTEEGSLTVSAGAEHSNAAVYFRTPFDAAAPAKRAIFSDGGGHSGGSSGGLHFCLEDTGDNTTKVDLTDSKMVIKQNGDVGIGYTTPTERFHVHENLPTSGHQIMARIGGDTSSYNTLVFGSKEGRPHIGGHRGDFGAWSDLSLQNDSLIISQSGSVVNVNGTLRIQGYNTKRVLIGYQKFENNTGTSWGASQTGYQNAWSVNYVRKKAGSQIYVTCDLCMAQAMGATATNSYRHIDGRLKVYDQVTDRYSNSTRDWQRIDNSFHEYQRQSRIYYGPHTLPGAQTGWTVTVVAQVEGGSGSGTVNSWGINIWGGRSVIEVYETMEA